MPPKWLEWAKSLQAIARLFEHHRHREWPTDFD
jgi:hypothetical protein